MFVPKQVGLVVVVVVVGENKKGTLIYFFSLYSWSVQVFLLCELSTFSLFTAPNLLKHDKTPFSEDKHYFCSFFRCTASPISCQPQQNVKHCWFFFEKAFCCFLVRQKMISSQQDCQQACFSSLQRRMRLSRHKNGSTIRIDINHFFTRDECSKKHQEQPDSLTRKVINKIKRVLFVQ